jgi:hypothetical protein
MIRNLIQAAVVMSTHEECVEREVVMETDYLIEDQNIPIL